jgi:tetratricopeptide (TPR) repeat protein
VKAQWTTAVVVGILITTLVPQASAKDRKLASEQYRIGLQHFSLGEFEEALRLFKESYRNSDDPILLFNIGQCHRQLNQKGDALRSYRVFLSQVPNAPNRDEVKQLIVTLEGQLQQDQAAKEQPPQGTIDPAKPDKARGTHPPARDPDHQAVRDAPSGIATTAPSQRQVDRHATPLYKRWWLWTVVGGVVLAGAAVGLGVGIGTQTSFPSAATTAGTFRF